MFDINAQDENKDTMLHLAARNGSEEIVQSLLEHTDIILRVWNKQALSPMHEAAKHGYLNIVRMLGEHPNAGKAPPVHISPLTLSFNMHGIAPFDCAVYNGHADVVEYLAGKGAPVNFRGENENGYTPLHWAVKRGWNDVISVLLSCKEINPDFVDYSGNVPLHLAAQYGKIDIVSKLAFACPKAINRKNQDGKTPLQMAKGRNEYEEIKRIIENADS